MFGDMAVRWLERMEHGSAVPGALVAEDGPAALERWRTTSAAQPAAVPKGTDRDAEENGENEPPVSLAHRAVPAVREGVRRG
jgi:hypothetical protein